MNRYLLLFNFVFWFSTANAQSVHNLTIYFLKNSDEINWNGEHALDSIFKLTVNKKKFYDVEIIGHADSTGSKITNLLISQQRANKVKNYFLKQGFSEHKITAIGKGFSKNSLSNDGHSMRKVEIKIELKSPPINLSQDERINNNEVFIIDNEYGGNIQTKSGTHLFIPSDGYTDKKGNDVTGQVKIVYQEFRTTEDFVLKGLAKNDAKELMLLNSRGMFEINAYQGQTKLMLKPSRKIDVLFGLNSRLSLLDLYLYTDLSAHWQFKEHITNNDGKLSGNRSFNPCGTKSWHFCSSLGPCEELEFMVNTGLQYAKDELTVREQFKLKNRIETEILKPLKNQQEIQYEKWQNAGWNYNSEYRKLKNIDSLQYQVERIKMGDKKSTIAIRSDANSYNDIKELKPVRFIVKDDIPDSLFKVSWDYCKISMSKSKKTNITLYKNGVKLRLKHAKAVPAKIDNKEPKPYIAYKSYKKSIKKRQKEVALRTKKADSLKEIKDSLYIVYSNINDSIAELNRYLFDLKTRDFECLFAISNSSFSAIEKEMTFDCWIDYFDENKKKMYHRYDSIRIANHEKFERCDDIYRSRKDIAESVTLRFIPKLKEEEKRDTVVVKMSITEFGLYDIARPIEIDEFKLDKIPVDKIMIASYYVKERIDSILSNQKEVDIIAVYLMKESLNGIYLWNGTYVFSPYQLPLSFKNCKILALDEQGNHYITELTTSFQRKLELKKITTIQGLFPR